MTRYRNHAIACLVVAAFACAPGSVFAQARFYGGGTTWDTTTANWSTVSGGPYNTTWTGTGIATFQGTSGTVGFNTVTATSVDFSVTGYVLNGNTLNMGGTSTLNVATSATATINATISRTGILTKSGAGTLIFGGTDASGTRLYVTGGTYELAQGGSLTLSDNGQNSIQLGFDSGATSVLRVSGGTISSTGAMVIGSSGNGTLNMSAGSVTLNGGFLNFGDQASGSGTANVSGGTFTFAGSNAVSLGVRNRGTLNVSGSANVTLPGLTNGNFAGATSIVNLDGGRLAVNSISRTNGTFSIFFNSGTLAARAASTTFMTGLTTAEIKAGGAVIDTNSFNITIGQALIENAGSTGGGLTKTGTGVLTLTGANTYTGTTTLNAGVINLGVAETAGTSGPLGKSAASNPGSIVLAGGTLQYSASNTNDYSGRFSTADNQQYNVDTNTRNVTWATALSSSGGSLTKLGSGTLTLSASNSYTGNTTINAGTLLLGNADALRNSAGVNVAGGMLDLGTLAATIGSLTGSGTITGASGSRLTVTQSGSSTFSGRVTGTMGFTKNGAGRLTLSTTNNFLGTVNVNSGTLAVTAATTGNDSALGNSTNTINVASGATLLFDGANRAAGLHSGAVNINGGTITLNTTNNVLGSGTTITFGTSAGIVSGTGQLVLNGTAPVVVDANGSGSTISVAQLTFENNTNDKIFTVADGANATDLWISSPINQGSGNLVKAGLGSMLLSGTMSSSVTVRIRAGALIAGGDAPASGNGVFGSKGDAIRVGDGPTQAGDAPALLIGGTFTVGRNISVGPDVNTNAFTAFLGGTNTSGTATFSGTVTLNTTASAYTGVTLVAAPGGTVNFTAGSWTTNNKTITAGSPGNTGTVLISSTLGGAGLSVFVTNGTLVLSASNTYGNTAGATTVRSGTLIAGNNAPSGGGGGAFGNATTALVLGDGSTEASTSPTILIGGPFTVGRTITVGSVANTNVYSPILGGANTSGTSTFSGGITLNTTASNYTGITLVAAPGGTVNFTGAWTTNNKPVAIGSAGNTGTVRLGSALATTGTVTVNNGTLTIGSGGSIGGSTTPVTINTGTLEIATGTANAFGASPTQPITINAGGVLLASNTTNNSTALGPLTLNGGRLDSNTVSTSGSATFALQGVTVAGSQLSTISALSISSSGTFTVGDVTAGTDLLVSSTISGTNPLRKAGLGTMAVTGLNTYSGTTFITAGALVAGGNAPSGSAGALGNASSAIVLGTDLTAAGDAPALLIGGAFDVGRAVSVGSLTNSNAYSPVLGGTNTSGTATFSGAITLNTTAANYTGLTLQAAPGGTVNFTGAWTTNDKPVTIGSAGNTGTVRLGSTLATTGTLTVGNGTLLVGVADAIGNTTPVSMAGGTLDLGGLADTIGSLSGASGTITGAAGSALTVTQATSDTYGGVVAGSVALTKAGAGTLTLTAANTSTGDTTISTGTLQVGGAGQLGSGVYGGAISNAGTLDYASSANQTLSGSITGNGSLLKSGAGTLTLSGSNSYSGGTQVTGGTLAFANGGLGSSGSVSLANSTALQWASGNTQDISSRLVLPGSGAATLDVGANNVTLASNFGGGSAAGIVKAGGGTLSLTSVQDFTGDVRVAAGILQVSGTNILQLADGLYVDSGASLVGQNGITVFSGQTLGGYGNVDPGAGSIVFNPGGILSPGGSVGELDGLGSATFNGGMQYLFEVNDATGTPGVSPGWDLFSTTGAVGFANTGTPIIVDLTSLAGTVSGSAANFNPAFNYAWKFVVAGSEINYSYATNPGWFTVQTSNFTNAFNGGFYVARGDQMQAVNASGSNTELYVVYAAVPEPSTLALAGIGLAAAGWAAARRRRRAA